MADYERVEVKSQAEWRGWLEAHHQSSRGIWLVSWKKATPYYLAWPDIVDEALCFGWIDSTARAFDADRSMQLLAPRKPRSPWSRINKQKIARLEAEGLLAPAGIAAIERARTDGSWQLLDDIEANVMPPDLASELAGSPAARDHFAAFPAGVQRTMFQWVVLAKRPATRAARVAETVRLAALNQRANQWPKR